MGAQAACAPQFQTMPAYIKLHCAILQVKDTMSKSRLTLSATV